MKTKVLALFLCCFSFVYFGQSDAIRGATNAVETFPLGYTVNDETGQEVHYYGMRKSLGEGIPETLPASMDPKGNWGPVADELQLSVRFRYHEFEIQEPVRAVVILRNLSSSNRVFWVSTQANMGLALELGCGTNAYSTIRPSVKTEYRKDEPVYTDPTSFTPPLGLGIPLASHTEWIFTVNLKRIADLSAANDYTVKVIFPVRTMADHRVIAEVVSGPASFSVRPQLSPAGVKEKQNWNDEWSNLWQRAVNRKKEAQ
jgi:hypothetical protein